MTIGQMNDMMLLAKAIWNLDAQTDTKDFQKGVPPEIVEILKTDIRHFQTGLAAFVNFHPLLKTTQGSFSMWLVPRKALEQAIIDEMDRIL